MELPIIFAIDSHDLRLPEDLSTSDATAIVTGSTTVTMHFHDLRSPEDRSTSDATAVVTGNTTVSCPNDIGSIMTLSMSTDEVTHSVNSLSDGEKYKLLTDHFQPSSNFLFPNVFSNGCNRHFQHNWLSMYLAGLQQGSKLWLLQVLCIVCCLRAQVGALANRPFITWIKVQKIVNGHAKNQYHANAVMAVLDFQRSVENL